MYLLLQCEGFGNITDVYAELSSAGTRGAFTGPAVAMGKGQNACSLAVSFSALKGFQ